MLSFNTCNKSVPAELIINGDSYICVRHIRRSDLWDVLAVNDTTHSLCCS